ncbi:hypothetical protein Tco_0278833, partial [Tanacetum coccineum]
MDFIKFCGSKGIKREYEAVSTACYVLNRGKFDGKSDEGFLVEGILYKARLLGLNSIPADNVPAGRSSSIPADYV